MLPIPFAHCRPPKSSALFGFSGYNSTQPGYCGDKFKECLWVGVRISQRVLEWEKHTVKWGFFLLDEELGLLCGSLPPRLQGQVTQLGSRIPFDKVETLLIDLLGVHISEPTVRRYSEGHGAAYEAVQSTAVAVIERDLPEPRPNQRSNS
jgi:hypothetical protein